MKKILAAFALCVSSLLFPPRAGALSSLFSANYLPHRYCYLAQPGLVWTNVITDALIALSYGVIFVCLISISYSLRSLEAVHEYLWIAVAFGAFIVACGATHLMEVVTIWWPVYPFSAAVKVVCAAASVPTAILFARISPALARNIRHIFEMLSTTQQEKEQAVAALVASEKLAVAGRLSTSVAHEMKNPLESVGSLLYLVGEDPRLPADMLGMVNTARSELDRASGVAKDMLALFQGVSTPVEISLPAFMQSVLDLQIAALVSNNITLEQRIRADLPLCASIGELRQVIINLIQNACAAIRKDGRILVRVQRRSQPGDEQARPLLKAVSLRSGECTGQPGYSITIADTGPGIDAAHRADIFTLFFTTKGDKGTGLGLWLVQSMVEKQGGRILLRSRTTAEAKTSFTVFNIWMPLTPTPIAAALKP